MKSVLSILLIIILSTLSTVAQSSLTTTATSGYAQKFLDALTNEDVETVRSLITNDFLLVSFDGQLLGGQMLADGLSKGILIIDSGETTERDVRTYGETGIVTGTWKVKASVDGTFHNRELIYTLVIVRQAADWKVATFQLISLPE